MKNNRVLSSQELAQFGAELDALKARVTADLGESDARYINNIYKAVNYTEAAGRGLLFAGIFPPAWIAGTALLGVSKILENMELGHNVMHGQYDWMRDSRFNGKSYEWDIVGTADNWRKTHNFKHHTYTNIKGMDDDVGYGILRLFPEQRWRPFYLLQPIYSVLFALLFQWGVAIQDLELGKVLSGKKSKAQLKEEWQPVAAKVKKQLLKDYVLFPLLAGPFFLPVLLGNLVANGMRNLWTFTIIFCGHFTEHAEVFEDKGAAETRAEWFVRQIRGSSNISGGALMDFLSGNLSHQIEHHMFPDTPANRYQEMAPKLRALCDEYGQHYNTGSFSKQFSEVMLRIAVHSLPNSVIGRARGVKAKLRALWDKSGA